MADEPTRFNPMEMAKLLAHCEHLNASDITIQTNSAIFAEVYGRLLRVTNRPLSNTEVGDLINEIYGSNATTQLMSGTDFVVSEVPLTHLSFG